MLSKHTRWRCLGVGICVVAVSPALAARGPVEAPNTDIVSGVFYRRSDIKNKNGSYVPPFTQVDVTNLDGFRRRPRAGETVTVVPLNGLPPFSLRVRRSKIIPGEDTCAGEPDIGVELETIKDRRYFEARPVAHRGEEYPFDAVVLYPAVNRAHLLRADSWFLTDESPRKRTVAAIDLDDDGREDALIVEEFCFADDEGTHGYTCQKVYSRKGGKLEMIREVKPC